MKMNLVIMKVQNNLSSRTIKKENLTRKMKEIKKLEE